MIGQVETEADHVLGIRVGGKVTENDIDEAIRMLEERLKRHEHVSFAAEIEELEGISPAALMKDISYGIQQLTNLDRFDRVALITNKRWIRAAAKLEGRLLPGVRVKAFKPSDREAAYAWVQTQ